MGPKLIMFLVFVFTAGTVVSLILEGGYLGNDQVSVMNELVGYNTVQVSGIGLFSIPKIAIGFLTHGLPKTITWDYSFLQGDWQLFKWIMLYPISAGVVWGLVSMFIQTVQGVFSRFI